MQSKLVNSPVIKPQDATTIPDTGLNINPYSNIGINLAAINDWSPEMPFINIFDSARKWFTQNSTTWDTRESSRLDLDANGYPKTLTPLGTGASNYQYVATLLNNSLPSYKAGKYVVLYDGQGQIDYGFDAKKDFSASSAGRDVINVNPTTSGIILKILSTDPLKTGNYIKNIRVVPLQDEQTFTTDIFNPQLLDKLNGFTNFRFMNWMQTNNSNQVNWSDRPTPDTYSYTEKGVPVEVMVALANKTGTDPWFCMPHQATDDYVRNFAQYVKTHLNPGLKVYVEYTNEGWNGIFPQTTYIQQQGKKEFPSVDPTIASWDWFSKRTTEVTRIWDQVFGGDKERVVGVMGAWAANINQGKRLLNYAWAGANKPTHQQMGIDAIAIAPYFGYYMGLPQYASQLQSWTKDPDGGRNKIFDEITKGGMLTGGPAGGALKQSFQYMQNYANLASANNLQLLSYESGQSLAGVGSTVANTAITNLFANANRDPRMGNIYKQYIQKWFEVGGGTMNHYSSVTPFSQWGNWGLLENLSQSGSPKYNAVMDMINGNF